MAYGAYGSSSLSLRRTMNVPSCLFSTQTNITTSVHERLSNYAARPQMKSNNFDQNLGKFTPIIKIVTNLNQCYINAVAYFDWVQSIAVCVDLRLTVGLLTLMMRENLFCYSGCNQHCAFSSFLSSFMTYKAICMSGEENSTEIGRQLLAYRGAKSCQLLFADFTLDTAKEPWLTV